MMPVPINSRNKDPLQKFIQSSKDRDWLVVGPFDIYVRKAHHLIGDELKQTFDLANFNRARLSEGGKGEFWETIKHLEELLLETVWTVVYIENVHNMRLVESLPKHGFMPVPRSNPISFYKDLKSSKGPKSPDER